MRIAFLGAGLMGGPMAARLLQAGRTVNVYNRTREKSESLGRLGAVVCDTPGRAIESADCVILMLADGPVTRQVLLDSGIPPSSLSGRTLIQMGTIAPQESMHLDRECSRCGAEYLEAPVLGSPVQAEEGKLFVMVGSTPLQFQRWSPLLAHFSPECRHVGRVGQAAALKLALNHLIAALTISFSVSLGIVQREGIDVELFMRVLRDSALYAPQFDKKLDRMLQRDFTRPTFSTKLFQKDLRLALEESRSIGLATAALEGMLRIADRAMELGLSEVDYSSVYNAINPAS